MRWAVSSSSIGLAAAALSSHFVGSSRASQVPFDAASLSTDTDQINLHRLCLPSSHVSQWPAIISSLEQLSYAHLRYDPWAGPHLVSTSEGHSLESASCLDFTLAAHPLADLLLDEIVHTAPRHIELEWTILADAAELRSKVKDQMQSAAVEVQKQKRRKGSRVPLTDDRTHNGYHPLSNITAFLSYQVFKHPQLAELVNLGVSYNQNIIQGLKLGKKNKKTGQKPSKEIVIVAGAHGREWLTTSTALYLISAFLEDSSLLSTFSVLIVPVLNPDGYAYTWTRDRFSRKNRAPTPSKDWLGRPCYGIDVSRNFPTHFKAGTADGCSPTYAGSEPLATEESKALSDYLLNENHEIVAYFDLHSYGQLLLYPWLSCTPSSGNMPDEEDLSEASIGAVRAARSIHNKVYRPGRGCQTMYNQDGSSVDFTYERIGVKWSFEIELRDQGSWGFLIPPSQIRETGEEAWAMIRYLGRFVKVKEKL